MSKTTVRVVAHLVALAGHHKELKSILLDLVEPTRTENGCILYQLLQNQEDPTDFVFIEEWESEALLLEPKAGAFLLEEFELSHFPLALQLKSQVVHFCFLEPDQQHQQLLFLLNQVQHSIWHQEEKEKTKHQYQLQRRQFPET